MGQVEKTVSTTNGFLVRLTNGEMTIDYIKQDLVHVKIAKDLSKIPKSWGIEASLDNFEEVKQIETETTFTLQPKDKPGLKIVLNKQENSVEFKTKNDIVLNSEKDICLISGEWFKIEKQAGSEDEHYFGFGENTGNLDKRDEAISFWNTDSVPYNKKDENLYQSQPIQIALRENGFCYAIIYDNPNKSQIEIKKKNGNYYTQYMVKGGGINYYILFKESIKDLFQDLSSLLGKAPLPPLSALGHHQSKWAYKTEEEVLDVAQTFREKRIPCDFIHLDIDYMDRYKIFTWNKERFPDPPQLVEKLKNVNFSLMAITDPGVKVEENYFLYEEGLANDHFIKNPDGSVFTGKVWPDDCHFPDFTRKKTREWFGTHFKFFTETGIEGFWIDMNEPSIFSEIGTAPDDVIHPNEEQPVPHATIHNMYAHLMAKATYEGLKKLIPNKRKFVLTRAAYLGTQRYAGSWTGDNNAEWKHLRYSLPMLMNMAISGQVMIGPDIGGFLGKPSGELLLRWYQAGIFYPFYRNHAVNSTCAHEPWKYRKKIVNLIRDSIQLRYKLLLYIYTEIKKACKTGIPAFRAMFIDYPTDPQVYEKEWLESQYLFGSSILVAPILKLWRRKREIYLPKGNWYSFSGEKYEGEKIHKIDVPLDTIPLFIKEGSIIPFIEKEIQSTKEIYNSSVSLYVFAEENAKGAIYLDDGTTLNYKKDDYELVTFEGSLKNSNTWYMNIYRKGKKNHYVTIKDVKHLGREKTNYLIFEK